MIFSTPPARPDRRESARPPRGFTLIELIISTTILALMLAMLGGMFTSITDTWIKGESKLEAYGNARGALEQMAREMTPAVTDTRMQYCIVDSEALRALEPGGEIGKIAPETQVPIWMAPLGDDGELHVVGYYLHRDPANNQYRLKRLYIEPFMEDPNNPGREIRNDYYPQMHVLNDGSNGGLYGGGVRNGAGWAAGDAIRTSAGNADWFLSKWDGKAFDEVDPVNQEEVVTTIADNVIAFWVQAYDLLGNPIPWIQETTRCASWNGYDADMIYNSAGYMTFANTVPFGDGSTTAYQSQFAQSLKANQVPAAVKMALITIDKRYLARGATIPAQTNVMVNGAIDLDATIEQAQTTLDTAGIQDARVFSIEVKLLNGS